MINYYLLFQVSVMLLTLVLLKNFPLFFRFFQIISNISKEFALMFSCARKEMLVGQKHKLFSLEQILWDIVINNNMIPVSTRIQLLFDDEYKFKFSMHEGQLGQAINSFDEFSRHVGIHKLFAVEFIKREFRRQNHKLLAVIPRLCARHGHGKGWVVMFLLALFDSIEDIEILYHAVDEDNSAKNMWKNYIKCVEALKHGHEEYIR